MGCVTNVSPK